MGDKIDSNNHINLVQKYIDQFHEDIKNTGNIIHNSHNIDEINYKKLKQYLYERLNDTPVYISLNNEILNDSNSSLTDIQKIKILCLNSELISLVSNTYFLLEKINTQIISNNKDLSEFVIKKEDELRNKMKDLENNLSKLEKKTINRVNKVAKREASKVANKIEKNFLTYSLTIMGIFSTIIIVIMNIIQVSNEWLRASNQSELFTTLIFTITMVLFSVVILCLLLYLMFLYDGNKTDDENEADDENEVNGENKMNKKRKNKLDIMVLFFFTIILMLFIMTIKLICK